MDEQVLLLSAFWGALAEVGAAAFDVLQGDPLPQDADAVWSVHWYLADGLLESVEGSGRPLGERDTYAEALRPALERARELMPVPTQDGGGWGEARNEKALLLAAVRWLAAEIELRNQGMP